MNIEKSAGRKSRKARRKTEEETVMYSCQRNS